MTKLALVTGGAHPIGIGFASATALRKLGFEVIVTGSDRDAVLEKLCAMVEDGFGAGQEAFELRGVGHGGGYTSRRICEL